jgi:hypothetical protein
MSRTLCRLPVRDWIKNCVCVSLWQSSTHVTKNKIFKVFAPELGPGDEDGYDENAANISSTNFRVTSVLTKTLLKLTICSDDIG